MATLATFRTAVASELGLQNDTSGDQTQIDKWVNEGVVDVVIQTACAISSTSISLTSGTSDYSLSASIMRIYDAYVSSNSVSYYLQHVTPDDVLAMRRASLANVSPAVYYAVAGNLLMVYPTPDATQSMIVYYVPRPATLSGSADTPSEIPAEYHPGVEYYALMRGASYIDDGSSGMGQAYAQQYQVWLRKVKRYGTALRGGHRLPPAGLRTDRSRIPFHDRSVYPA